ncbi:MAG TPA: rhodanese-like domain-containing protein [Gammaproteobacteria bacterium]|nr:rhodanese-like domain-containing protein [Gammaproteobacteria bacterium]
MRKGVKELVAEAEAEIETLAPEAARALLDDEDVQFVDLRDIREVKREGRIPGSFHCPRGMLEFWLDPESPYFHDAFTPGKRFVFYCNKGWRSALATQTASRMGLAPVCHIAGGFTAWKQADYPTED